MGNVEPFDFYRIFFGDISPIFLLEVIFRTAFMYVYMLIAARFIGKRGMGQLTPFEFIVVIVLGSAAGDPMFYPDVPLLHGAAVLTTVVVLERVLGFLTRENKKIQAFLESKPALVVNEGKINTKIIDKEQVSNEELLMQLRMQGVYDVGKVDKAYLEPSGRLSVFHKSHTKKAVSKSTKPRMAEGG